MWWLEARLSTVHEGQEKKKADECEYDYGKSKTRTQIHRETIVKLKHRIRELEDPEYVSTSVTL